MNFGEFFQFLGNFVWVYQKSFMNILAIKKLSRAPLGVWYFFISFLDFFMYVERENLSVDPIYPRLPGPCIFFPPRFVFVEMQNSYPSVLIVFDCILLCTYSTYHVRSWYLVCPWYETLTYPHIHTTLNNP